MLKAVARALPNVSFKGYADFDDTSCYYIHNYEYSYNGKQLCIKSTFMDDRHGYFCPHCGLQLVYPHEELESDEIECEDCEKMIKAVDLKYVPPVVEEEVIEF